MGEWRAEEVLNPERDGFEEWRIIDVSRTFPVVASRLTKKDAEQIVEDHWKAPALKGLTVSLIEQLAEARAKIEQLT